MGRNDTARPVLRMPSVKTVGPRCDRRHRPAGRDPGTRRRARGHDARARSREGDDASHPHLKVVGGDATMPRARRWPPRCRPRRGDQRHRPRQDVQVRSADPAQRARLSARCRPRRAPADVHVGARRWRELQGLAAAAEDFFSTLLRGIYADKLIGDDLIRHSGLDWTIVQPAVLTDGPLTRNYRAANTCRCPGCRRSRAPTPRTSSSTGSTIERPSARHDPGKLKLGPD